MLICVAVLDSSCPAVAMAALACQPQFNGAFGSFTCVDFAAAYLTLAAYDPDFFFCDFHRSYLSGSVTRCVTLFSASERKNILKIGTIAALP